MAGDSAPHIRTNDCLMPTVKSNLRGRQTPTNTTMECQVSPKLLRLPYVKGVSERIKTMSQPLGVKTVTKSTSTLRGSLVRVKLARSEVHTWANQQQVDWEAAMIKEEEMGYWKQVGYQQHQTSNLDCGLTINPSWLPLLNSPPCHP